MAVSSVTEVWDSRSGGYNLANERQYTRKFRVRVTTTQEAQRVVLTSPGIPRVGEIYAPSVAAGEYDLTSYCENVQATQRSDDWRYWDVVASYTNQFPYDADARNLAAFNDPLLLPANIDWDFDDYEIPVWRDLRGVPVVNSAGQRFNSPLTYTSKRLRIIYERNEATYDPLIAELYSGAVNSDIFLGLPPGRAQVHKIVARQVFGGGRLYYRVRRELHFRRETFNDFVLDNGSYYLSGGTGEAIPFRDKWDGILPEGLLNGKGDQLSASSAQLLAGIDETNTRILFDGTTFPSVDLDLREWAIKIDDEVMLVTDVEADQVTHTVTRGWAGTAAASHDADATISLEPVLLVFQLHRRLPFNVLGIIV